ncbi:hypothetical protein IJH74_01440 [Candidatus Saccharibacteria bacterium]|nr:hypothetical protein [Candidatus Saccharibacteria bacterium]
MIIRNNKHFIAADKATHLAIVDENSGLKPNDDFDEYQRRLMADRSEIKEYSFSWKNLSLAMPEDKIMRRFSVSNQNPKDVQRIMTELLSKNSAKLCYVRVTRFNVICGIVDSGLNEFDVVSVSSDMVMKVKTSKMNNYIYVTNCDIHVKTVPIDLSKKDYLTSFYYLV